MKLQKLDVLLIKGDLYVVVADYTEVISPLDYEIEHINDKDDYFAVSQTQINANLGNGWYKVNLEKA